MGIVYANIELLNGDKVLLNRRKYIGEEDIRQINININMMVDSGALMLTINEDIRQALGQKPITKPIPRLSRPNFAKFYTRGSDDLS